MGPQLRPARYVFDRFELRPAERQLLADGIEQRLTPRAFDLLAALVERPGELWSKDDLLARVWPGLVVEENNLQVQVSTLRRILAHDAIETVPGYGYRFVFDVAEQDAATRNTTQRRDNLPHALTGFIGRSREIEVCNDLLTRTRLLTVTGTGGIGKTRFALRLAESRLGDHADGVWLAELAALTDPRLVPQAIAAALGVHEQHQRSTLEVLEEFVRDRHLLLVVDNCEHVAHECAQVAKRLLQAGARIALLATSREPLHVTGETTYVLEPLTVPGRLAGLSVEEASESEAVRLYVERAGAVQHDFELTSSNAPAIAEICTRLDGIPLAIELAAARMRMLTAEGIAQRLHERFRLLKAADRTAPDRQRTLEAAVDWSYELLAPQEKSLLARLAVFAGGWTLEAAEHVGAGADLEPWEILDVHGNLVDKSLVGTADDERYRLLETVRMYAGARLAASGEEAMTRTRHLAYFETVAEAGHAMSGPEVEAWELRLDDERENFRGAYHWALAGDNPASALRIVSRLAPWLCRNYFDLGTPILGEVLAMPATQQRDAIRFHGVAAAGFLSYHRGRYPDAKRYTEEALSMAREIGRDELIPGILVQLGSACHALGEHAAARTHFEDALPAARKSGDGVLWWSACNELAELLSSEGDHEAATALYEETLMVARTIESRHHATVSLLNLARVSLTTGNARRAGALLREAHATFEDMGADRNLHALLAFTGALASLRGDWEATATFLGASDRELERMGMRREPADVAALAPRIAAARRGLGDERFAMAEAAGRTLERGAATRELARWLDGLPS